MSKKESKEDKPRRGLMVPLLLGTGMLAAGAGGTYGAVQTGLIGTAAGRQEPDVPQLVRKGAKDPFAVPGTGKGQPDLAPVHGDGGSEYRTLYYSFEEGFTSNLKDSPGLVQVSLAASTRHDGRVAQWLRLHELAVRSAILVELANTPEDDVYTVAGKQRLQERLTAAINAVLTEQEGFGGVDAVHYRSFLVQ